MLKKRLNPETGKSKTGGKRQKQAEVADQPKKEYTVNEDGSLLLKLEAYEEIGFEGHVSVEVLAGEITLIGSKVVQG